MLSSESLDISLKMDLNPPPLPFMQSEFSKLWERFAFFSKITEPSIASCCITLEDHPRVNCISCENGHFICQDALQPFVICESEKSFDVLHKNEGRLKCPACEKKLSERSLALLCRAEAWGAYENMRERYLYQKAFEQIAADFKEQEHKDQLAAEKKIMQDSIRNQFMKADGTFSGYSCPRCSYGPIDKKACDDLVAHHGQRIGVGIRISNSCPMCFWYGDNISQWKQWDGTFLDGERMENVQSAVAKIKDPYEEVRSSLRQSLNELEAEKNRLLGQNEMLARVSLLEAINQFGPQYQQETDTTEDEVDESPDPTGGLTPYEIRMQMNTAGPEEHARLGSLLIKALARAKKNHKDSDRSRYLAILREMKTLGHTLLNARNNMEAEVGAAVAALSL